MNIECGKCSGKGEIKAFAGIDGGRCWSCAGKGFVVRKAAPKPTPKFAISAIDVHAGERRVVFTIKAKNAAVALQIAQVTLARGNGFIPGSAAIAA